MALLATFCTAVHLLRPVIVHLGQVWDKDLMDRDDLIGEAIIQLRNFDFGTDPVHTAWYTLQAEVGLIVSLTWYTLQAEVGLIVSLTWYTLQG